ncbi:GH3 domain-containing protein [Ornithorhynchus anatinus]|uniref:GH3 domain containing n=1 Tax=Ornithorhynchus anatinus TaxID=9258 RepID=A0A6I8NT97_ORNAN|nr:GH3 domain-containing protein [Ornithorhynchus anatinus]
MLPPPPSLPLALPLPLALLLLLPLLPLAVALPLLALRRGPEGQRGAFVLWHCLALRALPWVAAWQKRRLDADMADLRRSQERALRGILRPHPGGRRPDPDTFLELHPVTRPGSDASTGDRHGEEGRGGLEPHSPLNPYSSPLQATLLGLDALARAFPEVLRPGATACLTPASPWPSPLPWPLAPLLPRPPPSDGPRAPLLAALRTRGLQVLEARTASELLDVFSSLVSGREQLLEDVASGRGPPAAAPAPVRATELAAELQGGPDGLARRLWPQLRLVVVGDAGGQGPAAAVLGASWCQGVRLYTPVYTATGGVSGLNLWPERVEWAQRPRYLLTPGPPFCELLQEGAAPPWLLGEEYELGLTSATLARCSLGDVVRVVDFHNQSPVVEFVRRRAETLSVRGEGMSEDGFYRALLQAAARWPGARLVDYCSAESCLLGSLSDGSAPHYEVFVELRGVRDLSEGQRDKFDRCLQDESAAYKSLRFRGSVGPARVHLLGPGAFQQLRGAAPPAPSPALPRVLRRLDQVQLLQSRVVS